MTIKGILYRIPYAINVIRFIYSHITLIRNRVHAILFDLKSHPEIVDAVKFHFSSVSENVYCVGCSACAAICPKEAITLKENNEGFLVANIDENKCIHCDACVKVCPTINVQPKKRYVRAKCFAAQASDEIRRISSSGGIFTVVASAVLDEGGVVFGASWCDGYMNLKHTFVDNKEDLQKFRLSKYVQSDLSGVFPQVRSFLNTGRKVLFSGTPCQIAGLKKYLGKVPDSLLTIDVVCCGVPSRKVYRKFIEEEVIATGRDITSMTFRNKDNGWRTRIVKIGAGDEIVCQKNSACAYEQLHFCGVSTNRCCEECPFDTFSREGDITLGDFWGIEDYAPSLDDNLGTSLVFVNTPKASQLLLHISPQLKLFRKVPQSWSLRGNINIIKPIKSKYRKQFFFDINRHTIRDSYSRCIRDAADVIIFNNAITAINYGSMLTAYAAQELFINAGYYAKTLNHARVPVNWRTSSFARKFADEYLNLTEPCQTDRDFLLLNSKTDIFVVGSDQLWRTKYWKTKVDKILMSFVDTSKLRIACAISFGMDKFEGTELEKAQFRSELKYYKQITVREDSGVSILKDEFGVDSTWILDPVFILAPNMWQQMADKSNISCANKLVCYGWHFQGDTLDLLQRYAQSVGCDGVVNLTFSNLSVEDWLNSIRTARVVVSDSYHCICFSIIFKRKFVVINNIGQGRFYSLDHLFDIANSFVGDVSEIKHSYIPNVNYQHIENVLSIERNRSNKILIDSISL